MAGASNATVSMESNDGFLGDGDLGFIKDGVVVLELDEDFGTALDEFDDDLIREN